MKKFNNLLYSLLFSLISILLGCYADDEGPTYINTPTITTIGYGSGYGSIFLNWEDNLLNLPSYTVYRSENNADFTPLATIFEKGYSDTNNIIPGKVYYYKVRGNYSTDLSSDFSAVDSGYTLQVYGYEGSFGSLNYAYGIEFDHQGNIYISDRTLGSVNIYNNDYSFKKELIKTSSILRGLDWSKDSNLLVVNSDGGGLFEVDLDKGTKIDHFVANSNILREVITDKEGNMYVSDVVNNDVVKLDSKGVLLKKWKIRQVAQGNSSSLYTSGLEFLDGQIYISGVNSNRYIEVYDVDGNFIRQFDFTYSASQISQDNDGNLYYSIFSDRVVKTDKNGRILAFIGMSVLDRSRSINVNAKGVVFVTDESQPSKVFTFKQVE